MSEPLPEYWWGSCPFCGNEGRFRPGRYSCDRCGISLTIGPWASPRDRNTLGGRTNPVEDWDDAELKHQLRNQYEKVIKIGDEGAHSLIVLYAMAFELALRGTDPWVFLQESYPEASTSSENS